MKILIRGLQPGRAYAVQVRTNTGEGVSQWSRLFNVVTNADGTPPDVPAWISPVADAWVVDGDTFAAQWLPIDPAVEKNKDFNHYELTLSDGTKTVTIPTQNTAYVLTFEQNRVFFGTPKATVTAKVRSVDNAGNASNYTSVESESNPAPAGVPSVTTNALYDAIQLSWPASVEADFKQYIVQVSTNGAAGTYTTVYSGTNNAYQHTSVNWSTDHYFKVFVQDKFNTNSPAFTTGAVRPKSAFVLDTTAPPTPTGLNVSIVNSANGIGATATVTWTMASVPSDLSRYVIRYRKVGDTAYQTSNFPIEAVTGTAGTATIELQNAYTNYEFQIKTEDFSNNSNGFTATVTAAPPAATAPADVTGFTSTPGRDAIRYDWTPVANSDLKNYEITFSTSSTFASGNTTFFASGSTMTVSGLTPATTYYARIRAVNVASVPSANWSGTNTRTTLAASSAVSVADLTGGQFSAIDMVLGPSSNLIVNGGSIKSNTYTGTTASNSNGTAGFYLGNDGLTINRGNIKAEALSGGTFNAGTINIAAGGSIVGGGWALGSTGLSIPNGGVSAASIMLQTGENIMPPIYSDFEGARELYSSSPVTSQFVIKRIGTMVTDKVSVGKVNTSSLAVTTTVAQSGPWAVYLGTSTTDYNVPIVAGETYIFSGYTWTPGTVATNVQLKVQWSNGSVATLTTGAGQISSVTSPAGGTPATASRISGYATAPAGVTGAIVYFESSTLTANTSFNVDGVQVETKTSFAWGPSPWTPGNSTLISGGQIRTGEIRSTDSQIINGVSEPTWSIPLNGAATFSTLRVLGNSVLGRGETDVDSVLTSSNFKLGTIGWQFRANGTADLRGLSADSISGDSIVANTVSLNALKSNDPLNAAILISNSGSLIARNDATGAVVGISGTEGLYVRGPIQTGQQKGPTYISFPILPDANGNTAPNIISGVLTATTLSVSGDTSGNAATLFANNYMELGSTMTLRNQTSAAISAPTVISTWAYTGMTTNANTALLSPYTPIGTTNTYLGIYDYASQFTFNAKTFSAAGVETAATDGTNLPNSRASYSIVGRKYKTPTQVTPGGNWYMLVREQLDSVGSASAGIYIYVFNSSWVYQTSYEVVAPTAQNSTPYRYYFEALALGNDGTQLLLAGQTGQLLTVTPWSTAGVKGTLVNTNIDAKTYGAFTNGDTFGAKIASIQGTSADFGSAKWVVTHTGTTGNVMVLSTAGVYDADLSFPVGKYGSLGTYWNAAAADTRFIGTTYAYATETGKNSLIRYSNIKWTSTDPTRWGVATTRYDSVANQESNISPITYFTMAKRSWYSVTADSGAATGSRLYIGRLASGDLDVGRLFRQDPPMGAGLVATTRDTVTFSGNNPGAGSNPYSTTSGTPAKISSQATDTLSGAAQPSILLQGDGYARIKELNSVQALFASGTMATALAGNKPALRVGNTSAAHLRVSDDRLIAMTNDNTQGILYLNNGGTTVSTQMVLSSPIDAATTAGNMPALRVGDIAGNHLRIDGNEILSMATDTGQGNLYLNQGGVTTIDNLTVRASGGGVANLNGVTTFNGNSTFNSLASFASFAEFPGAPTTTTPSNVNFNGVANRIRLVTSLSKWKLWQQEISFDDAKGLLDVTPKTWYDKTEVYENGGSRLGVRRIPGFVAEDMDEHAPCFTTHDDQDELNGVAYDRVSAGLLVLIKVQAKELNTMKTQMQGVLDRLNQLEAALA